MSLLRLLVLSALAAPASAVKHASIENQVLVEIGAHHFSAKGSHVRAESDDRFIPRPSTPQQAPAAEASSVYSLAVTADTSNISAAAMIIVLCASLAGLVWMQRASLQNSSRTEIVATSCVVVYIALTITVDVCIRRFHQQDQGTGYQFSPAVITTLIEIAKLLVMICGALFDWDNTISCSFAEIKQTAKCMTIPAICFVALNIGRWAALSGADLDQYRVWRCTDIIWVAALWFTMFKKTPATHQIAGIGLVFFSCLMMQHQDQQKPGVIAPMAILIILGLAFVSSLGLVMNEFGLKASANLSLFVQSITLYSLTSVLNSVVVLCTVPVGQIFHGIGREQWALIALDCMLGLSVACVLKYANAMVKQLASGWLAPLEPLIGHFIVGTPVTPTMVFATVFAGAGSIIYRLPEDKKEADKNKKALESDNLESPSTEASKK